jgi:hypothetical protein
VVFAGFAVVAAACSNGSHGPGVASVGSGRASSSGASTPPSALAYSRCMRAHGIKDFPDPNSRGELALNAEPGSDIDPGNPTYQAADGACKRLLPNAGVPPPGLKAANLKYAKCMRAHGISDFPDPKPDGTLQIQAKPGGDLDSNNPQNKSADKACKRLLPDGGRGGSLNSTNG